MKSLLWCALAISLLILPTELLAQCLTGGGTRSSEGSIPGLAITGAVAGAQAEITLSNLPAGAREAFLVYASNADCTDLSQRFGAGARLGPAARASFGPSPFEPSKRVALTGAPVQTFRFPIPAAMGGTDRYLQAFVRDAAADGGFALSHFQRIYIRTDSIGHPASQQANQGFISLPEPDANIATVEDPHSGRIFVYGRSGILEIDPTKPFNERWRITADRFPSQRGSMLAFSDGNVIWILGGIESETRQRLADVYRFDSRAPEGARLRREADALPAALSSGAVAWNAERRQAVIFGGANSRGYSTRQIMIFDPAAPAGARFQIQAEQLPTGAMFPAASYDPLTRLIYLVGTSSNQILGFDLGRPDGSRLSEITTVVSSFEAASVARHPGNGKFYIFGGRTGSGYLSSINVLDPRAGGALRYQEVAGLPQGIAYTSVLFHSASARFLVFGGSNSRGMFDHVVEFDPVSYNRRPLDGFAEECLGGRAFQDAFTGRIYFLGDGGKIHEIDRRAPFGGEVRETLDRLPGARTGVSLAWNGAERRAYLFGGRDSNTGERLTDIYTFAPGNPEGQRLSLQTDRLPAPRAGASAVWDDRGRKAYIFGGTDVSSRPTRTIFEFNPAASAGTRVRTLSETLPNAGSPDVAWDAGRGVAYIVDAYHVREYRPTQPDGARLSIVAELPGDRIGAAVAFDSTMGVLLVVGGWNAGFAYLSQVLQIDPTAAAGERLSMLNNLPYGVGFSAGLYDALNGLTLTLGGDESSGQIRVISVTP